MLQLGSNAVYNSCERPHMTSGHPAEVTTIVNSQRHIPWIYCFIPCLEESLAYFHDNRVTYIDLLRVSSVKLLV